MTQPRHTSFEFTLQGLHPAPSQVWGAVRLVPLIRDVPLGDLRLVRRDNREPFRSVVVDGTPDDPKLFYHSYIPYGMVVSWTDDGQPVTSDETYVGSKRNPALTTRVRAADPKRAPGVLHRMVKRQSDRSFRMLPLHLAMEGFLGMYFGGPDIAWDTWSKQALRTGLSPRIETAMPGFIMPDLSEALRVFEIHDRQCGVLLFIGDSFASAFVVSHPDDYRALHTSLIEDFYGELLLYHGWYNRKVPSWSVELSGDEVTTIDDLDRAYERGRASWAAFDASMATGLIGRTVAAKRCRRAGPFALYRFLTELHSDDDNHIGELMRHRDGTLAYLKTYRLTAQQTQRIRLLRALADNDWILADAARATAYSELNFKRALQRAGLGALLHPSARPR